MTNLHIQTEVWKDIKGYEGLYSVSNFGRIRSHQRMVKSRSGSIRNLPARILKYELLAGYPSVVLCHESVAKHFKIHRLVAFEFCKGYFVDAMVNHLDGVKTNNNADNLEWTDGFGNMKHAYENGLFGDQQGKILSTSRKMINIETGEIFNSITLAAKAYGISKRMLHDYIREKYPNKTPLRLLESITSSL